MDIFDIEKPTKGVRSTYFDYWWDIIAATIVIMFLFPIVIMYSPIIVIGIIYENIKGGEFND